MVFVRNDGHSQLQCILYLKHPVTKKKSEEGNETGKSLFSYFLIPLWLHIVKLAHCFIRSLESWCYSFMDVWCHFRLNEICKKAYLYFADETVSEPLVMFLGSTMYIYLMYRITILVGTNWILCNCTTEISREGCSISSVW